MLLDDSEKVKFAVGESYVDLSQDEATEHIEKMVEDAEAEVAKMQGDLASCKGRMKELKSLLTVKFGKSINLEEEE
jgi:chaperonin cofactor prefoldin